MPKRSQVILVVFALFLLRFYVPAVAKEDTRFCFAVLGCMHLGLCDVHDYEQTVERIKQYSPDFVVFLGGMLDPTSEEPLKSLWQQFDSCNSRLGVPTYNVPSNCRLLNLRIPKEKEAAMERYYLDRYKKRYYSFEHKNNLFIGLDSISPDLFDQNKCVFKNEELDFLNQTLANTSKYNKVFVFMHNSPWLQYNTSWFKTVDPLLRGKVKYVFGANKHLLEQKKSGDLNYITAACPFCSIGQNIKPSFPHFLIVDVDRNNVSVNVVALRDIPIENLQRDSQEKRIDQEYVRTREVFKTDLLSAPERELISQPERVTQTLKIKPGMNILDIGAGTGLFTFPFAKALNGTGKVFATDVDMRMINYLKKKAEDGSYKNIFPVAVKLEGLDPFYKQQSFDIIFLAGLCNGIIYPLDYFSELRPSLKKNGRLYIIYSKTVSDFSEVEFEDFKKVVADLLSEGEEFPIFKRLSKEIRDYIINYQAGEIPIQICAKIIQDFNRVLLDRWLWQDLAYYYAHKIRDGWRVPSEKSLDEQNARLANWLVCSLQEKGVFDKKERKMSDFDIKELKRLNRILLTDFFHIDKLPWLVPIQGVYPIVKHGIVSTLEEAGYEFVGEHDFLIYDYFLEFKRRF